MTSKAAKRYIKAAAKGIHKQMLPWVIIGYFLLLVSITLNLMTFHVS